MFTNSCQDLALDAETPIMVRSLCPQFVDTTLVKDSMEALPSEVAAGIMASTGGELLTPELVGRECMKLVTTSKTESNTLFVSNGDLGSPVTSGKGWRRLQSAWKSTKQLQASEQVAAPPPRQPAALRTPQPAHGTRY